MKKIAFWYLTLKKLQKNILFKNFSYLILNHIISQTLMFLAYSLLARRIAVENFGNFGFAEAYYRYFLFLLNLGLPLYAIKKFALLDSEQEKRILVNRVLSTRLVILFALVGPYIVLSFLLSKNIVTQNLILLMGLALIAMVFNLEWYFRAIQKMQFIAFGSIAKNLFFLAGIYLVVYNDSHVNLIGLIYSFSFFVYVIVFMFMSGVIRDLRLTISFSWMFPILKESLILGLSFIVMQVYHTFGLIVLGISRPESEVAYFTTISKLLMFLLMISSVFLKAVFPHLAELGSNRNSLFKFIVSLTRWSSLLSLLTCIILFVVAKPLIVFIFGDKYGAAVGPFQILIFTFWIVSTRTLIENSLIITDKSKKYVVAVAVGAACNIILNSIFTPIYGIYATTIVTLISQFVFSAVAFHYSDVKMVHLIK